MPGPRGVHIVAPTIVRYTMKHQFTNGHPFDIILDLSVDPLSPSPRDSAVNDVNSHVSHWWQSNIINGNYQGCTYLGAHWIDLDSSTGPTGDIGPSGSDPTSGSVAVTLLPPNSAALIHKHSGAARGSKQGRLYWPLVAESDVDNQGIFISAARTASDARWGALLSVINGYSNPPVVQSLALRTVHVHKPDKTDPSTWTWSSSTVTSLTTDPLLGTQRRRMR